MENFFSIRRFVISICGLFVGEEPGFPSTELERHGPTINGWKSSKSVSANALEHELILQFESRARLGHIQLLAHQYLIRKNTLLTHLVTALLFTYEATVIAQRHCRHAEKAIMKLFTYRG